MEGSKRLVVLIALLITYGCTMIGSVELAGPAAGVSADDIPDAVPRSEPPSRSGNMFEYEQSGRWYRVLDSSDGYERTGTASWYGADFHGRPTSSGEPYDMYQVTAAHRTLPLPSYVEVTNLANGRTVVVRVNDRGPFHDPDSRIIDLSYAAATKLGMVDTGTAAVRVRAIEPWQTRLRR